jgi:hypothetical protein
MYLRGEKRKKRVEERIKEREREASCTQADSPKGGV